jgi:hypothetical protein
MRWIENVESDLQEPKAKRLTQTAKKYRKIGIKETKVGIGPYS